MTTVATVPAYITLAFDTDGKLKIRQIQERLVIKDANGKVINGNGEGELQPIRLITAPQPDDAIEATLKEALDAATTGALLHSAALEAENTALTEERDRLRIITDAFPQTDSAQEVPASAAEPA